MVTLEEFSGNHHQAVQGCFGMAKDDQVIRKEDSRDVGIFKIDSKTGGVQQRSQIVNEQRE